MVWIAHGEAPLQPASFEWHPTDHSRTELPRADQQQVTITVSGTVIGPSNPIPDDWIDVSSSQDWQTTTTNAIGLYNVSIQTDGQLKFRVRPELSIRLTQVTSWMDGVTGSFVQNSAVTNGYLLSLRPTGSSGTPISGDIGLEAQPLIALLPEGESYTLWWDEASQRYQAMLPPDIYYVTATNLPTGYYETTQAFDLRTVDQIADMPLNTNCVHPIPYDPPDASKITIGPVDDLGEAIITGASGAALPLAHVLLVNLNSVHQGHAISEADGSFTARIYAPPGSYIMVKHGPASERWCDLDTGVSEGLTPFPGTIIYVSHPHIGGLYALPFAATGDIDCYNQGPSGIRRYVGSAWAMTGTLSPVIIEGEWTRVLSGTYNGRTPGSLYLGGLNWTHPALADLDGDGDLDLVIGERSGHLVYYRNDGGLTGGFSPASWTLVTDRFAGVDTGDWAVPAFADLDTDGDLDLLVGTGQGQVAFYRCDPDDTWTLVNASYLSVSGYSAAPAFADLDGDGDLDLLINSSESGWVQGWLYYFRRDGTPSAPVWTLVSSQYAGISGEGWALPAFADIDGDGDVDLLVGQGGRVAYYRNDGPPTNPTWTLVTDNFAGISGGAANSPAFGDLDGDGNPDLLCGEQWGHIAFYRHDGAAWAYLGNDFFPFDLYGDSAPALADWDNDGDLDMLIGQVYGQVYQYTNVGSTTSPDWRPDGELLRLPWTNHPHAFPTLADMDGDSDYDLFIGEGGFQGADAGGNIHYYRNDGTPVSPDWTLVTTRFLGLDVGGWATPSFVDIDADDDLDLFIGDEDGTLTLVENTGTPASPVWAAPVRPYADLHLGDYSAPAFLDIDGDGDLDLLSGQGDGTLAYVRNDGTRSTPRWTLVTTQHPGISTGDRSIPAAADLDGDGHADLILGDGDGGINFYRYLGRGTLPPPPWSFAPGDQFQVTGTLRIYSPAITAATPISGITAGGWLRGLKMLFGAQGQPFPDKNWFMSTLLTPTGFPVERQGPIMEWLDTLHFEVANLRRAGDHAVVGDVSVTGHLPADLPAGIYRPTLEFDFSGVPTNTQWLAAKILRGDFAYQAVLPPIVVGEVAPPRLVWRLLMDDFVQGTRGTGAREDEGHFALASEMVSQGAPFSVPPVDVHTGQPITYRLEPFLPMISFTDRTMPTSPLLPFDLPGGQLNVQAQQPDGTARDLGTAPFAQSFNRTKTTRAGCDLNFGSVQLECVYSLTAGDDRFRITFDQYGHYVITMTGTISDVWANTYVGGGTYDVWVAHPLDIDPGVLPGTPFQVGDTFNSTMQLYPRVPADVHLTVTFYPDSDPAQAITHTVTGQANDYGYFHLLVNRETGKSVNWEAGRLGLGSPVYQSTNLPVYQSTDVPMYQSTSLPITLTHPGEYRVYLTATYTDPDSALYMGAMTWGGVVETPNTPLVAHGRRGLDSLTYIPSNWFVSCRDLNIPHDAVSHTFNPYFNGDIIWSRTSDAPCGGDSLVMVASVQDTLGDIEATMRARAERNMPLLLAPGDLDERFAAAEIPLFTSTRSGRPPPMVPNDIDQLAYSYRSSQRPGVRVREMVAEDAMGGYWRLNTLYDDQLGVGLLGDQPNDFKFQYVGTVYRDLDAGINQYAIQGSLWVCISNEDPVGSRVMPPFAGPGNGGWTTEGGPILTLKGKDIHIFILPTGTRPGAVLEVGDTFSFAGHIAPTLDSQVAVTVTAPNGTHYLVSGQANRVGYFYDPDDDFVVNEPGLWSVDVRVWHDGQCSGGATIPPYPSGDVLGSEDGRYWFYVVPGDAPCLDVSSPSPGFLSFDNEVTPITIAGEVPAGLSGATVDYTINMPGYILDHGQVTPSGGAYQITFDPVTLHNDFPNLDLVGRDDFRQGLSDTFAIGLLLRGQSGGDTVYRANTITVQGEQVFVREALPDLSNRVYLPLILKGG